MNYDRWNAVDAEDEEPAAAPPKAALNVEEATGSSHRCKLSAQQVDEIFCKTYVPNSPQQNGLRVWREQQEGTGFLRAAPMSEGGGLPEDWQIETLDTHRWWRFKWRPVECIPDAKHDGIFRVHN